MTKKETAKFIVCADHRIDCIGDTDGTGSYLMYGIIKLGDRPHKEICRFFISQTSSRIS